MESSDDELTPDELAAEYWQAVATVRASKALPDDERRQLLRLLEQKFKSAWNATDAWLREPR